MGRKMPADQMGRTTPHAPAPGSRLRSCNQLRIGGKAKIIIAAEIDKRLSGDLNMRALRAFQLDTLAEQSLLPAFGQVFANLVQIFHIAMPLTWSRPFYRSGTANPPLGKPHGIMPAMSKTRFSMSSPTFWRHPLCFAPRVLRPWLTEAGSLTARLKRVFPALQVRVLQQDWQRSLQDEAQALHLPRTSTLVARREVLLMQGDTPLVFAHSITRREALRGGFQLFGRVGARPLGALLFADPTITRLPLAWRCVDRRHPLWQNAQAAAGPLPPRLWARRSVFFAGRDRLLVTELFLPAVTIAR